MIWASTAWDTTNLNLYACNPAPEAQWVPGDQITVIELILKSTENESNSIDWSGQIDPNWKLYIFSQTPKTDYPTN